MNVKKIIYEFFEYIIALVLVLECRSIFNNMPETRTVFWRWMMGALLVSVIFCIAVKRRLTRKSLNDFVAAIAILALYFIIYVVASGYNIVSFRIYLTVVAILAAFCLLCCDTRGMQPLLLKYSNIICIIAAVSLFFWLFGSVIGILSPTGTVLMNWVGTGKDASYSSYYNIYFEVQPLNNSFLSAIKYKNTALFVEAPMFSLHLSLALLIELFVKEKLNKIRCVLLVVTILTTFSTSGYILAIFAIGISTFLTTEKNLKQILMLLSPLIIITVAMIAYNLVFAKLSNLSGLTRMDDFMVGWKIFRKHPLMGVGYDNYLYLQSQMSSWRSNSLGMSSSLMMILSYGGLYFFTPYAICMYFGMKSDVKTKVFTILLIYLWIITVFPFQYIFALLCMYLVSTEHKTKNFVTIYN